MSKQDGSLNSCPFCPKQVSERTVFESDVARVIIARDAIAPGQALVVSKRHVQTLNDLTHREISSMYSLAKRVADIFTRLLKYDGVNLLMNSGKAAGQIVLHAHIHVVPRKKGDVPVPKNWLDPTFRKIEYQPTPEEVKYFKSLFSKELNAPNK